MNTLCRELEESRAEREEARANLGVVAAACREMEVKARKLQEHRRVLAREVKALRAEKKRLSAALSCATAAASAAAAAAAATAEDPATAKGEPLRQQEPRDDGNQGEGGDGQSRSGNGAQAAENASRGVSQHDDERAARTRAVGGGKGDGMNEPGVTEGEAGALARDDIGCVGCNEEGADFTAGADDVPRGCESTPRGPKISLDGQATSDCHHGGPPIQSGITSPEAYSPHLLNRSVSIGSTGSSIDAGVDQLLRAWNHVPDMEPDRNDRTPSPETDLASFPDGNSTPTLDDGSGDKSGIMSCALSNGSGPGLGVQAALPESRFSVMVQSFSSGLRESKRSKRTPLLGSLDDDDNVEDEKCQVGGAEDGKGGGAGDGLEPLDQDARGVDDADSVEAGERTSGDGGDRAREYIGGCGGNNVTLGVGCKRAEGDVATIAVGSDRGADEEGDYLQCVDLSCSGRCVTPADAVRKQWFRIAMVCRPLEFRPL